ncbi:hypothetical protein [Mesorhizobium sanjuanii]|uniref:hypothetical protein n=1 Tax=Mesorhizobium sanjuanii TaxID=2037900 RepID=UPI0013FE0CFD|nr:hypothetical protein [Mesorhizobium sanjuanii]
MDLTTLHLSQGFSPVAPVRRADVDSGAGYGILPAFQVPYTSKHERMLTVFVEDGQFEIATKRSALDLLPHWFMIFANGKPRLDLHHFSKLVGASTGQMPVNRFERARVQVIWLCSHRPRDGNCR